MNLYLAKFYLRVSHYSPDSYFIKSSGSYDFCLVRAENETEAIEKVTKHYTTQENNKGKKPLNIKIEKVIE